ncbi:jg22329 [Pararge aegeria aegeria]|uniref:Jg22329 protein n=1 Tax=Pararge aegeria aegeria TaxID=348720 RepID=A0A8S4S2N9_9NEOP|nr:jg22329 [Pararge aegeria aegeria]
MYNDVSDVEPAVAFIDCGLITCFILWNQLREQEGKKDQVKVTIEARLHQCARKSTIRQEWQRIVKRATTPIDDKGRSVKTVTTKKKTRKLEIEPGCIQSGYVLQMSLLLIRPALLAWAGDSYLPVERIKMYTASGAGRINNAISRNYNTTYCDDTSVRTVCYSGEQRSKAG